MIYYIYVVSQSSKTISQAIIAIIFLTAGIFHFIFPEKFLLIVPPWIPFPVEVVYITGVFEILGALGILYSKTKKITAVGLAIFLILVFPANIYMAIKNIQLGGIFNNQFLQWARLPFQAVLIWYVLWSVKDD